MEIKAIRKLPELEANQEWACEGGCDVIKPKYFENVFSQSTAHDGSSIKRQSEFFWTCQNNHLLRVWCTDKSDYILLPEDFYQAEVPKIVESNSIQESINILDQDIDSLKDSLIKDGFLTNEDADILEQLITKAMQLGEFYAKRDAKAQTVPDCITDIQSWIAKHSFSVLDICIFDFPAVDANELAEFIDSLNINVAVPEGFVLVPKEPTKEMIRMGDLTFAHDECVDARKVYKAMIEAQEQSHEH